MGLVLRHKVSEQQVYFDDRQCEHQEALFEGFFGND
jgi:hypothetical protein